MQRPTPRRRDRRTARATGHRPLTPRAIRTSRCRSASREVELAQALGGNTLFPIVARITRFKAVLDLGASVPGQVVATHLLRIVEEVRAERRREMSAGFGLVQRLLTELLPAWSWAPPKGGLTLWVRLPFGSARELAAAARRKGVAVLPGTVTSPDMSFDGHLRLTVSREPDVLVEGMRRLAAAWEEYAPAGAPETGRLEVIV